METRAQTPRLFVPNKSRKHKAHHVAVKVTHRAENARISAGSIATWRQTRKS